MSAVVSISAGRRYGIARICRVWRVARSGVYRLRRGADVPPAPRRRPGPQGPMADAALVEAIRRVLIVTHSVQWGMQDALSITRCPKQLR